jgi:hypothetical protein
MNQVTNKPCRVVIGEELAGLVQGLVVELLYFLPAAPMIFSLVNVASGEGGEQTKRKECNIGCCRFLRGFVLRGFVLWCFCLIFQPSPPPSFPGRLSARPPKQLRSVRCEACLVCMLSHPYSTTGAFLRFPVGRGPLGHSSLVCTSSCARFSFLFFQILQMGKKGCVAAT